MSAKHFNFPLFRYISYSNRAAFITMASQPSKEEKRLATLKRDGPLHDYLVDHSFRHHEQLEALQQASLAHPYAGMVSPPDSVAILQQLLRLVGAKLVIEVGVFTGYTTLGMALALPGDGRLIACDVSEEFANIGKPYWKAAGVADRIDLRIGPASKTLDYLLQEGRKGTVDATFLDADKTGYDTYYEQSLQLLRPGGIIIVDNVLWNGSVINEERQDDDTKAIRALNIKIFKDERVDVCMLRNSDGITVARKR